MRLLITVVLLLAGALPGAEAGWVGRALDFAPTPAPFPWGTVTSVLLAIAEGGALLWWWRRRRGRRIWTGRLVVRAITPETPGIATFTLARPDGRPLPFRHRPGQYLTVKVRAGGRSAQRCYSISTAPQVRDHLTISVKREERGLVSGYLHAEVAVGALLDVSAPMGDFIFEGRGARSIVLVGGGVGLTPLMSVVRWADAAGWPGEVHLLHAARTPADLLYRRELEERAARRDGRFFYHPIVEADGGEAWPGARGRIGEEFLRACLGGLAGRRFHLCGPPPMMTAVTTLLGRLGVAAGDLCTESFAAATGPFDLVECPAGAPAAGPTITFAKAGRRFLLPPGRSILEVAEAAGIEMESACRSGTCGTCKVKLAAGAVRMERDACLSARERAAGIVLACQAKAAPDLVVEG